MARERDEWEDQDISGMGALDAQPGTNRSTYLQPPDYVRVFVPEKNKSYKRRFLFWKAGQGNTSKGASGWTVNRFFAVHANLGATDSKYLCLAVNFGLPCPGCEWFAKLKAQGADWDKVLYPLKPKNRELMLMFDPENPKQLELWDESTSLFGNNFRNKYKKRKEWQSFAHPTKGCIVDFDAQEKKIGRGGCVDCSLGIEIEVAQEGVPEKFLDLIRKGVCPDNWLVKTPYEKLKKIIAQTAGEKKPEEENGETEAVVDFFPENIEDINPTLEGEGDTYVEGEAGEGEGDEGNTEPEASAVAEEAGTTEGEGDGEGEPDEFTEGEGEGVEEGEPEETITYDQEPELEPEPEPEPTPAPPPRKPAPRPPAGKPPQKPAPRPTVPAKPAPRPTVPAKPGQKPVAKPAPKPATVVTNKPKPKGK